MFKTLCVKSVKQMNMQPMTVQLCLLLRNASMNNANASSSGSQHMDQVKSVITLRGGKVIEKPILEPCKEDDESISKGKEGVESEHCKEKTDSLLALPFPHAMTKQEAIDDEKDTENVVADHLSKLIIDSTFDIRHHTNQ